jgi:hypothetical protein
LYLVEIWLGELKLADTSFTTTEVNDDIEIPDPISGTLNPYDWVEISDDSEKIFYNTS